MQDRGVVFGTDRFDSGRVECREGSALSVVKGRHIGKSEALLGLSGRRR
jgi:hypothetical protein